MRNARKLRLEHLENKALLAADLAGTIEFYSVDGSGNNLENPDWGSTDEQLVRLVESDYADGISVPSGEDRPSERAVSNAVAAQGESVESSKSLTDLTWLWGQFIDHDIDLTGSADPAEPLSIEVPLGDVYFDPFGTGTQTIDTNRSMYDPSTGETDGREQLNQITAFLDGSVIYGSDQERADALRTFEGGHLATSEGDLLPFNELELANASDGRTPADELFLAGDVRANENVALSAMQTVWVREHNRIADNIAQSDPSLTDEEIFQQARACVVAEMQAITYNEYLPALLGQDAIDPYSGYDSNVDAGIANFFSTAAYRYGHSMLSSTLLRLDADGNTAPEGNIELLSAFFSPTELTENGIDSILRGAAAHTAQEIDTLVVDDVRNFLFGPPGSGGFDLASLNIARGRDHGLPSYNDARVQLGLEAATSFADITSNVDIQIALTEVYDSVDDVDAWVGGLAEDHAGNSNVGELFTTVLVDQFTRIRDGDRLWYQNQFSGRELEQIENTSLADVIERNTGIEGLQRNVFYDSSVLYYGAPARRGDSDIAVVGRGDMIEVVDRHARRVLDRVAATDIDKIILVGRDRADDHFTIDLGESSFSGSIEVHGGAGRHDVVRVVGTAEVDSFVVENDGLVFNGQYIDLAGLERLVIAPRGEGDDIQVDDDVEFAVDIQRPPRSSDPPTSGDGNPPPPPPQDGDPAPQPLEDLLDGEPEDGADRLPLGSGEGGDQEPRRRRR